MKLSFRKTGISHEVKRRILMLIITFVVAVVAFFFILNFKPGETETIMSAPTLPVMTPVSFGQELAPLHGYVRPMEAAYMRDSLIPLDKDRVLPLRIKTYGNKIKSMTLELRSLDTSRKIAQTKVSEFTIEGDVVTAEPSMANLLEEGQEYMLVIDLECEDRDIYYYTRITRPDFAYTEECLEFTRNFSDKARSEKYQSLAMYLEPDDSGNEDTLAKVDIHSSLDQVGWKGFDGELISDPVLEVKDMSASDLIATLSYYLKDDAGYYFTSEYFRVRRGEERVYLLDYERTFDRFMDITSVKANANKLELGPISTDPVMMSNETGTVVAFFHMGSLYEYNQSRRMMTEVFSFSHNDPTEVRGGYMSHGIRILNIDESGTMDFVVYGYMNAGAHEGQCGIDIYHYNSSSDVAREIAFLTTTSPYQILAEGISDLLFRSSGGNIYIMVDGTLERIDPVVGKTSDILGPLADSQYAVSRSGRYIAWIEEENAAEVMHIMDLNDESTRDVTADDGELLCPLTFMTEDLVYGCMNASDLNADAREQKITPMYKLCISDVISGEIIKVYSKKGLYTTKVVHDTFALYLTRMRRAGKVYRYAKDDTILASHGEQNQTVTLTKDVGGDLGEMAYLVLSDKSNNSSALSIASRVSTRSLQSNGETVEITVKTSPLKYYVYVSGQIVYSGTDLNKAIDTADEGSGVVVDNHQNYVWRNGRSLYKLASDNVSASAYDSAKQDDLLDLTGCSVSQMLYYVYLGENTYGMLGDEMVTIAGYNSHSITVYHPSSGKSEVIELDEATERFADKGNIFFVEHK